jgi:hypothetical protein
MDAQQVRYLMIAKTPTTGAVSIADGSAFNFDSLALGEVVAVNVATGKVDTSPTSGRYIFYQKTSEGDILSSPVINTSKLKYVNSSKYTDATQKVMHIGSNGTTGSFPADDNLYYNIAVKFRSGVKALFTNDKKLFSGYKTTSSATEQEVVTGLTKELCYQAIDKDIKVELIVTDAGDAIGTGVGTVTYVKGSKTITFGTDVDDTTGGAAALAVGIGFRIGTAVTSPVYIIEAINTTANTITVHAPVQVSGSSSTTTNFEQISAADLTAGSFGIQITGLTNTEWKRDFCEYEFTDFTVELSGNGFEGISGTVLKNTTTGAGAKNSGKQIADLEARTRNAQDGGFITSGDAYLFADAQREAVSTIGYDVIDLAAYDDSNTSLGANSKSQYSLSIAVPSMNYKITVPASPTNSAVYSITVGGATYSYTSDANATTAEVYAGLMAAMSGTATPFVGNGTSIITVYSATAPTVSAPEAPLVVATNTTIIYPSLVSLPTA